MYIIYKAEKYVLVKSQRTYINYNIIAKYKDKGLGLNKHKMYALFIQEVTVKIQI